MVPLIISVAALVWAFRLIDGVMAPLYTRLLGQEVPGLGLATTLLIVFVVGALATNVFGKRMLQSGESYLLKLPVFRAVYSPVKQLVAAFSPENELAFKRVVLVDDPATGFVLGFLTKEFDLEGGGALGIEAKLNDHQTLAKTTLNAASRKRARAFRVHMCVCMHACIHAARRLRGVTLAPRQLNATFAS